MAVMTTSTKHNNAYKLIFIHVIVKIFMNEEKKETTDKENIHIKS